MSTGPPSRAAASQVAGGPALSLLRPEELELLVIGVRHLDFYALEKAAQYEAGYTKDHLTIKALLDILHGLPVEQKKQFLAFCTGSDR